MKPLSFVPLVLLAVTATTPGALGQAPQPSPTVAIVSPGNYTLTWNGVTGRSYFVQVSDNLQTSSWSYAPFVELGAGTNLVWGFASSAEQLFLRLKYTDQTTDDPKLMDFDGDGISNLDEIVFFDTDPFVSDDTDGDGYLNADETAQGTNPNSAASQPFDPYKPPFARRFVAPRSWWIENKFFDTVEALESRNEHSRVTAYETLATNLADGSYDLPYLSIQAAVNAASAGDVIEVAPGTYTESVNLTGKNVRLLARRGSREETRIEAPSGSAQAVLLGSGNTSDTVVSGFTINNAYGAVIKCQGGTTARVHNVFSQLSKNGIVVDGASPMLFNIIVDATTGTASTEAGLRITGTSVVKAANCTFTSNVPGNTTAGQVQVVGASAALQLVNGLVWSSADRPGGQITAASGGAANVTYSSVRSGFAGTGNLRVTDAAVGHFVTDPLIAGLRLTRTSPCVDRGNPVGLPGFTFWTRVDPDHEARRPAFGLTGRPSTADIGADEYVSRLQFPTFNRIERGVTKSYSAVDEASDVAFLGTLANGNAKIAIINDETIEDSSGVQHNDVTFCEISQATGEIISPSFWPIHRGGFGANETKDPEGLAYDSVNRRLYITTSHTRVDHYRGGETSLYDPLIDPPANDYDPRRGVIVTVQLDANLNPTGTTFTDSKDGDWSGIPNADRRTMDAFASAASTVSPAGFDSTKGLIATLRTQLQSTTALQGSIRNTGVLLAINTAPKFGTPANGIVYQPGAALPYGQTTGLGGPSTTAGWVLHLPTNASVGDFPYWTLATPLPAAGHHITGYKTTIGGATTAIISNQTYYFKAWAYSGSGGARVYGRGLEAEATTNDNSPIKVNEIYRDGGDWVEFFNPSGIPAQINGLAIADESMAYAIIPNTPSVNIAARSFYKMTASAAGGTTVTNLPYGLGGSDGIYIRDSAGTSTSDDFRYRQGVVTGNTTGRIWDGGPRGKDFSFTDTRFECEAGIYRGTSAQPTTDSAANHTQAQGPAKFLQATANHITRTGVFLHYANLGEELAVWKYSPKQQDFHPINVEGLALKSQSEIVVGLRSPLSHRTTGNAYAFVFSNASNAFLPASGWTAATGGFQSVQQLNLNGQGIRSVQWVPQIKNSAGGTGAYLIIGGAANGGPLKFETGREKFSLYRWDSITSTPVQLVADLAPFATRPEGVNIVMLNGKKRVIFVEDRYKAQGYDAQNAVHWPLAALNLQ